MRFIKIYTVIAITFLGMSYSSAQESFDRLYRVQPDRSMFGQSIQQLANETYVVLSTVDTLDPEDIDPTMVNLTTFDPKGNVNFSNDYAFEDTISLVSYGNIVDLEEGFILSAMSAVDSVYNNLVFRVDQFGNPVWSNKYGSGIQGDEPLVSKIDILNTSDSVLILMGSAETDNEPQLLLTGIDIESGDQLWSKSLNVPNNSIDAFNRNVTLTNDSTLLVVGTQGDKDFFFLTEVSPEDGSIIWSETYNTNDQNNSLLTATDVAVAEDSTIVVTGNIDNDAFVVKLDRRGNLLWSHFMQPELTQETYGQSIEILDNGNIVLMVGGQNDDNETYTPIQAIISPQGAKLFSADYSVYLNSQSNMVEIVPTIDGGAIFAGTGLKPGTVEATDSGFSYTRLIKTNLEAETTCEAEFLSTFDTLSLSNDTLLWDSADLDLNKDTLEITTIGFGQYTAPILSLRDTMFCPGDPVSFLLDATTPGAVQYLWYKADEPEQILSADSTFTATELDVQYVAEVTIREDICYIMCDTTVLTDLDPPTVQLQIDPSRFCDEGLFEIEAVIQGSSITSVEWSTGESAVTVIETSQLGNYSVTVTNTCDDTGSASIDVTNANLPPPVNLVLSSPDPCASPGEIILGVSPASELTTILWSTGATGPTIAVTEPGTYSVSATDICGFDLDDEITLTADNFLEPLEIAIVSENCSNDVVDLSVSIISGSAQSINWTATDENGASQSLQGDAQIGVPANRTYNVIVQDQCQNSQVASITDPCQCLKFPNAFFPDSRIDTDINKNFGPVNSCSAITSYNLKIFNRWGQKVFESDAIDDEWNGMKGSSDVRGDVFVYVATYETEGGEFRVKGDVTLLK